MVNGLGKGHDTYGLAEDKAPDRGQWGAALRYQPEGTQLNMGFYAMNFHDKTPQFSVNIKDTGAVGWTYAESGTVRSQRQFPGGRLGRRHRAFLPAT